MAHFGNLVVRVLGPEVGVNGVVLNEVALPSINILLLVQHVLGQVLEDPVGGTIPGIVRQDVVSENDALVVRIGVYKIGINCNCRVVG